MTTLSEIKNAFLQTGTDKYDHHGYDQWYSEVFKDYAPNSMMEIGVKQGRSLASWKLLFPHADISGVDIHDKEFVKQYINMSEATIHIGDATKKETTDQLGTYDVIIDDGSHYYKDIIKSFHLLKDKFNYAYVIEDCMYKQEFTMNCIRRLGFNNMKMYPSFRKNILVDTGWLKTRKYARKEKTAVSLYMIVIYKN